MLILTRKPNESILINDNEVEVKILEVKGRYVRIGINAPKTVSVHREEIYQKIQEEKKLHESEVVVELPFAEEA